MKNIFEQIEHVKGKPHHVRKQVAFGAAAVCTTAIALVWLAGSISTGVFALKDTSFAQSTGEEARAPVSGDSTNNQLAGVGAASALERTNAPARIEIVDSASSAPSKKKAEQTVIPF
ncbi:MAG: hypothetical protein Q7R58_01950 [bacterium]|nr:hypothetical protein [bacterium]